MNYLQKVILGVLVLITFSYLNPLSASTGTGFDWLNAQVSSDNNYSSNTYTATQLQSLSEMEATIHLYGGEIPAVVVEQITNDDYNSTEYLSRKISMGAHTNANITVLSNELIKHQNFDGSFGELPGYDGSVIDTAYALKALSGTQVKSNAIAYAVSFLLSKQTNDGGWSDGVNISDVELTSITMHALWYFRKSYNVTSSLEAAKTYIINHRQADSLWQSDHQSALALIAIAPTYSSNTPLLASINALEQAQHSDQSWSQDIYSTALVLQALSISSNPVPNPDLGSIQGIVVDDNTGIGLADVNVTLNGVVQLTDAYGVFVFSSLPVGDYTLNINKESFSSVQAQILFDGKDIDFGEIRLQQSTASTTATVRGLIIDSTTQLAIANAKVTVNGVEVYTDSTGAYQASNVTPGSISVQVEATNYLSSQKTIQASASYIVQYSVSLTSIDSINADIKAVVKGMLIDNATQTALADVQVLLTSNSSSLNLRTDYQGNFISENLSVGNYQVTFAKEGYINTYGTFVVDRTQTIDFGVIALKIDDPNATEPTSVRGAIVDKMTKEPVSEALITVNGITTYTNADGSYSIENVGVGVIELSVSKSGYEDVQVEATLTSGSTLIFSPELTQISAGTYSMFGTILDANTSEILPDANITISGSIHTTVFTNSDGSYYIEGLTAGNMTVSVTKLGYKTIIVNLLAEDANIEFSPSLHNENEVINGKSTIHGRVIDLSTEGILDGVQVYVDGIDTGVRSDINGTFVLDNLTAAELQVTLKKAQYRDIEIMFAFEEPQNIELGTLKMRPITVDDFKADLTSEAINTSTLVQDPYSLKVLGDINVTIANRGTIEARAYDVIAFYDLNADGNYTQNIDRIISEQRVTDALAIDSLKEIVLDINTTADFRDQPIHIIVDAKNENIELNEANNYNTTAKSCGGKQANIDLAVCFDYSGSVGSLANMQKNGLIAALRDPEKFPRDGSIRLTIMTATNSTYLQPTVIDQNNAESVADTLANQYFRGNSYVDDCLRYASDKLASLDEQSSYKAVTISGDGYWGGNIAYDRDYAIAKGIDVIDVIGVGRLNWNTLNAIVYPQPAGGDFGVINVATTADEVSSSLVRTFKKQTEIADLTIGKLSVIDHGADTNISISFRVGNAGVATIKDSITVSIYEGDPNTNGVLLKSVSLDQNISSGTYIEMSVNDITLHEGGELYVVGDVNNALVECSKLNNIISTTLQATTTLGDIVANTDKATYGAFEDVNLSAVVTNPGRLSYALSAQLQITDTNGVIVQSFAPEDLGVFNSGESKNTSKMWNTSLLLSGNYELHALLYDSNNNIIAQVLKGFSIDVTSDTTPSVTLNVRTDKTTYHTSDQVVITDLIENKSLNNLIAFTSLHIDIKNANGESIYSEIISVGALTPNAIVNRTAIFEFSNMHEGEYTVVSTLNDILGLPLTSVSTTYNVLEDTRLALQADMTAQLRSLDRGETQTCTASVLNNGTKDINALSTRGILVYADTQTEIASQADTITILTGDSTEITYTIPTAGMDVGEYFCIFQAELDGVWETMAHDAYILTEPPIQINTQIDVGTKAPLLVLVDSPQERGWCLNMFSTGYEGRDPYGPYDAPMLTEQRAYLENLLDTHGYSYKIVDNASDFQQELRSGNYSTYALFNEYIKLSSQTLSEVREAVYRGDGLLFAGKHQYCNDELQTPLGLDFKVTHDHVTSMTVSNTNEYTGGNYVLLYEDKATRFELDGAEQLGSFEIDSGFFDFCPDDEKYALTRHQYKNGRGVFAAFDLLMQASDANAAPGVETILLEALKDIQPDAFVPTKGSVYPMHLSLSNEAIATQGQTITTFSAGSVIDAGKGSVDETGKLYWSYILPEGGTAGLDYWLKIPDDARVIDVETSIYAGDVGFESLYATVSHTINVDSQNSYTLQDALTATEAESGGFFNFTYDSVEYHLNKAVYYENRGDYSHALSHAIEAADCLVNISKPEADEIHNKLAYAIRVLSTKL